MKTSDPGAYSQIETITASSTNILNIRAIIVVASTSQNCRIQGTSWEKDSSGIYKSVDFTIGLSTGSLLTLLLPIGLRTISAITPSTGTATVYGLR